MPTSSRLQKETTMDLPIRKTIRLPDYDYNENGAYFITICTKDRVLCLSDVTSYSQTRDVGDAIPYGVPANLDDKNVGTDVLGCPKTRDVEDAKIILSEYGEIAKKYIEQMNNYYSHIWVDKYVIMPDHIHLILKIECADNENVQNSNNRNSSVSNFVSAFKRFCNKEYGENIWQRSFFDHVIRNEHDYIETWQYIDNNPLNWLLKYSPNLN